jgi:drug/metabolite transporter (DMT)-like permease
MNSKTHIRGVFLKGFLYSLAGTFFVSTNYITAKYALNGFNPETFSLIWTSAAAVYTFIIVIFTGHSKKMTISAHNIGKTALLGLATGVGMIVSWAGLARLDPSFAAFLWRFAPVLIIVLSALFLDERLLFKELGPIAIMIIGGCLSVVGRWNIVGTGIILSLFGCCAFAVQMLMAKMVVADIHPNVLVFYRVGIGALVIALWTFLTGKADFSVKTSYWLVTFSGAFLGPCLSFILTFQSYRYWGLSRSTIVRTAQPLFVLPMAYLFLGKLPAENELLGGCVILAGALWFAWIHFIHIKQKQ